MLRFRFTFVAAMLASAGALAGGAARADDLAAAQALVDQGNRAAAAGDYATALDRFRAAYAQYRGVNILYNIGTTLRRLGRDPEAAVVYEQYLRDPQANPARVDDVRRALAEIDAAVARVTIASDDPGARIWLDGRELVGFGSGGLVRIAPGEHTVAAGRAAPAAAETIRVAPGEARSVWLRVPGAPPPIPVAPAPVVVADRTIPPPPDAGEASEPSAAGALKVVTAITGTAGGLTLLTGVGAGIYALVQNVAANEHCLGGGNACEPRALELARSARTAGKVATVTMGVGGGLLAATLILLPLVPKERRAPRLAVRAGPGGSFLGLSGTW